MVVTKGNFVYGSSSYVSEIIPLLEKALEAKGYLPRRESSSWQDVWHNVAISSSIGRDRVSRGNLSVVSETG